MKFLDKLFGRRPPEPPSDQRPQDRFADEVIAAIRETVRNLPVDYDAEKFELIHTRDNGKPGQRTFLNNIFAEYSRTAEANRPALLRKFAGFVADSQNPAAKGDLALDTLMPVLRSRADMVATGRSLGIWPYNRAARPFCDTMLLMLALDSEHAIRILTDEQLAEFDISFDDALGIAIAHLNDCGEHKFGQLGDGTFVSTCGDSYDASRLLVPGLIEELPVKGNPVALVESRSALLVTGSDDPKGLEMIARYAIDDFPNNDRAVSLTPIELVDGAWRVFKINEHHPLALRNLIQHQRGWSYQVTREYLQEELGDDVFVASAKFAQDEDGRAATLAAWAADTVTACPIVDAIMIQANGDLPEIMRSFADVMAVCGPFPIVETMPYPPRYLLPAVIDPDLRRELTEKFPDYELFPQQRV